MLCKTGAKTNCFGHAGTPVKMPYYGISIAEAVARKQAVKWFTGLLSRPYLPWSFDQNPSLPNGFESTQ